jgi:hypothetical protein
MGKPLVVVVEKRRTRDESPLDDCEKPIVIPARRVGHGLGSLSSRILKQYKADVGAHKRLLRQLEETNARLDRAIKGWKCD